MATNAGGIRMIRHGNTCGQVLGIEAVLADGCILRRWSPLIKDNVGYDLPGLLGGEGTLAVITEVLFALVTPPAATTVAVLAIDRVAATTELIAAASRRGLIVEAAEIMTAAGIDLVHEYGARRPVAEPARSRSSSRCPVPGPSTRNCSPRSKASTVAWRRRRIRSCDRPVGRPRNAHESTSSTTTSVVKLDVSVPIRTTRGLRTDSPWSRPTCKAVRSCSGHVGDGNIHVNHLDVPCADEHRVTEAVFAVVAPTIGGGISAEHGIQPRESRNGSGCRTDVDIVAMRTVKSALDPQNLLNPGVLAG